MGNGGVTRARRDGDWEQIVHLWWMRDYGGHVEEAEEPRYGRLGPDDKGPGTHWQGRTDLREGTKDTVLSYESLPCV